MPRLIFDADADSSSPDAIARRALELRDQAWKSFRYFERMLWKESASPIEVVAEGPMPHIAYSFKGVSWAEVLTPRAFCFHHSFIIIVNRVLLRTGRSGFDPEFLKQESQASALEITKCLHWVEHMPITMLGIFSMAYPPFFIEQAIFACAPEHKEWLQRKLHHWVPAHPAHS